MIISRFSIARKALLNYIIYNMDQSIFTSQGTGTVDNVHGTNLFIGDLFSSGNHQLLLQNQIKYVLNLADVEVPKLDHITYEKVYMEDNSSQDLIKVFPICFEFIDKAFDENVLIHCHAGKSRSAAILIGYIINKYDLSYDNAYNKVKLARPMIEPNRYFQEQLKIYKK
jgi:dual specificity phosphatase 12